MTLDMGPAWLRAHPDRCSGCGFHPPTQGHRLGCAATVPTDEYGIFVAALQAAIRPDGTLDQTAARRGYRGRVTPARVKDYYRRARDVDHLIADTGHREESTDTDGRNADKLARIYRWVA